LTPVNPTTTLRIRAHYTGPFGDHTMLLHAVLGATLSEFQSAVATLIVLFQPLQWDGTTWPTAEFASPGSNIFLPVRAWTPIYQSSTITPDYNACPSMFLNWAGRDTTVGTRVKLYLFETYINIRKDMRWNHGENSVVDAVVDALNDESSVIGNIAGRIPVWNNNGIVGENAYLTHKARR